MAKVFVADDNPHVQRMVEDVLGADGHEVSGVSDGADLLQRVSEASPDLVLMDVSLPAADTYDICRGILAQRALADTAIIMLAGPLDSIDSDEATQAGVRAILQKPLSAEDLSALVQAPEDPDDKPAAAEEEHRELSVEDLVQGALEQPQAEHSREVIREQVEAVITASMPAMIDRITDRLAKRLRAG